MARRHEFLVLGLICLGLQLAPMVDGTVSGASELLPSARILLRSAEHLRELDPVERFALARQLSDTDAQRRALADPSFPTHLRQWAQARQDFERAAYVPALEAFRAATASWPRGAHREAHLVRVVFDRQRIACAVLGQQPRVALDFAQDLRGDPEDPVVKAWIALALHRLGRLSHAGLAERLDHAWRLASRADRHDPVFLHRVDAHLALGDREAAAEAWSDVLARATRPRERSLVLQTWDGDPQLHGLVDVAGFAVDTARWLSRNVRREEALELLRSRLRLEPDDADAFAAVAEQLYRLRRHADLSAWLDGPWPASLDDEQRAELEALPLGAQRRSGASLELARAFEAIARKYPQTRRSVEALWEAGWMYELEEEFEDARRVYREYVQRAPRARYSEDAALRAMLASFRLGVGAAELEGEFERYQDVLGDDAARAGALWLQALRARAEDDEDAARRAREALAAMSTPVPLSRVPRVVASESRIVDADRLVRRQREAFDRVGAIVEAQAPASPPGRAVHVRDAGELLRIGWIEEAELELLSLVRDHPEDTRMLLDVCRTAWRYGSPEVQARVGYLLRRRLEGRNSDRARDLWVISRPTPFYDAVLAAAEEFGLAPTLLWAVMRRESFYDPDVVSIAGAHGLVQLMPATARDIVDAEGWDPLEGPELLRPEINLRLGAQHLRERLDDFGGSPFLALAAYNAGPSMARRWAERMPADADPAFAALLVSYTETRGYVYDVLRNAAIYDEIAASSSLR